MKIDLKKYLFFIVLVLGLLAVVTAALSENPPITAVSDKPRITADKEGKNDKININTALEKELELLNGIGEVKAKAIVAYREKHGSFKSIKEIKKVKGITEKIYNSIKDKIEV